MAPLAKVAGALGDLKKVTGPAMEKLAKRLRKSGSEADEVVEKPLKNGPEKVNGTDGGLPSKDLSNPAAKGADDAATGADDAARKGGDDASDAGTKPEAREPEVPFDPTDPKQARVAHADWSDAQKGEFGEAVSDRYMTEKLGLERVVGPDAKGVTDAGIDGIYKRKVVDADGVERTQYVIMESKFSSADRTPGLKKVNDEFTGDKTVKQMSDTWLSQHNDQRIYDAAPSEFGAITKALSDGRVSKIVTRVGPNGDVALYKVDARGGLRRIKNGALP